VDLQTNLGKQNIRVERGEHAIEAARIIELHGRSLWGVQAALLRSWNRELAAQD
jgi:hypothetical protein